MWGKYAYLREMSDEEFADYMLRHRRASKAMGLVDAIDRWVEQPDLPVEQRDLPDPTIVTFRGRNERPSWWRRLIGRS